MCAFVWKLALSSTKAYCMTRRSRSCCSFCCNVLSTRSFAHFAFPLLFLYNKGCYTFLYVVLYIVIAKQQYTQHRRLITRAFIYPRFIFLMRRFNFLTANYHLWVFILIRGYYLCKQYLNAAEHAPLQHS
ncbi:hypothetical protein [Lonomia obliqua multiple nucleopolyhedrovirus]|uniref:Uncharacterized protein n=1 Tax=Lonomia obliqua multiple nucleopolyhedrovirus TaxID=134394 RepID=A0A126FCG6_9ABAC|nr:hypothetical protein [Lonomia obliqua multiple nucleopolyhedrovirus]AKN81069.1 hypothetical protein [Lonomia obliqua multiple nucleopolyhedrovirus]